MPRESIRDGELFKGKYCWKKKPIAALDQDPPVTNTWYTLLDTTEDVRLILLSINQINDEVAAKDLEVKITKDGVTLTGTATCDNNTWYFATINAASDGLSLSTTSGVVGRNTALHGHSVKLEVRQTSAVGTNQKLDGRLQYETLEET